MPDKSAIEWTDATWNPVTGCSKVSPGCAHCYAEAITARFAGQPGQIEEHRPWTPENAAHNVTWRADVLREIPAAVRFISAEPLLGTLFPNVQGPRVDGEWTRRASRRLDLTGISWVIVGGESGSREARPMHPTWARELRDACAPQCCGHYVAVCCQRPLSTGECCNEPEPDCCQHPDFGPAFFFKQWGSHDEHGVYRGASPKSGGRLLDGREWNEMPAAHA
jgi:protein gp37